MNSKERKIRIRAVQREEPELRRLARAMIELAIAEETRAVKDSSGNNQKKAA